jgi:L-ascorbate metabolism protein UlaG (beta-lactamase superfamily)
MGSESTLNVGRGVALSEKYLKIVNLDQTIKVGPFTLKFIESIHGPAFLGRVPYPGTIDKPLTGLHPAKDYKLGQTYALVISHPSGTIVHHGSAGFIPGMYEGVAADVVLLGIVGRGDTKTYLKNIPLQLGAKLVIPLHYDNFFIPLEKKMRILPSVRFKEFLSTANRYHDRFELKTLTIGEKTVILPVKKK